MEMARRPSDSSERDEYFTRYSQLSQQSEDIRRRLSVITSGRNDEVESPLCSPARRSSSISTNMAPYSFPSASAWPIPVAVPPTWRSSESERVDEAQLFELNQQIKTVLTDLLNCEEVKHDNLWRAWTQARLMDAEHELKRQRRRRSSVAQETLRMISVGLDEATIPACRASF